MSFDYILTFGFLELPYGLVFTSVFIAFLLTVTVLFGFAYLMVYFLRPIVRYITKFYDGSFEGNALELAFDIAALLSVFFIVLLVGNDYILVHGFDEFGQPFEFAHVMLFPFLVFYVMFPFILLFAAEISDGVNVLYYQWKGKSQQWIAIYQMSQQLRRYHRI